MDNFNKELETATSIAKEAGIIMLKYFDTDQQVETKKDNTWVTIADKSINSLVIERLSKSFPLDGVIGEEESTTDYGYGRKWFCDPIDGTAGYVNGVPTAMFSLALVIDGKPKMGVAYDPYLDRMYTGTVGGSFCNGKVLQVSNKDLKTGTVAVTGSVKSLLKANYLKKMVEDKISLTCFSGAVNKCCLIAKGKLVAYVEHGANAHDMAAVQVILEGAGGKVTSTEGKGLDYSKRFKGIIASNSIVHDQVAKYCL